MIDLSAHNTQELLATISNEEDNQIDKEQILTELVKRSTISKNLKELDSLIEVVKKLAGPSKITLAKLFKAFLDAVGSNDDAKKDIELEISKKILDWTIKENKTFLKTKLIIRIAEIYFLKNESRKAKDMIDPVIAEAQKVEDKALLIESQLLDAKILVSWKDWGKAKAALSSCRAAGSKIYVAPALQAEIECVSGIIHLFEKDYTIACSYFMESLEGFHQQGDLKKTAKIYRNLLMSKILLDNLTEAQNFIDGKHGETYSRFDQTSLALLDIFYAYKAKSLVMLTNALETKAEYLQMDNIVYSQLESLYSQLLEKNIVKLISPYSRIELSHLSKKLQVSEEIVEHKLCEMILDQKLRGSINQDQGILILFPDEKKNEIFDSSLEIINNMNGAVSALFERAKKLKA